jgi:hypothetical protein
MHGASSSVRALYLLDAAAAAAMHLFINLAYSTEELHNGATKKIGCYTIIDSCTRCAPVPA